MNVKQVITQLQELINSGFIDELDILTDRHGNAIDFFEPNYNNDDVIESVVVHFKNKNTNINTSYVFFK